VRSYKREEDGIVLVNPDTLHRLQACARGRAHMARASYDADDGVMKKCTLCVDRIYNENLPNRKTGSRPACAPARPARATSATWAIPTRMSRKLVAERGGFDLLPQMGYKPVNKYLPPRPRRTHEHAVPAAPLETVGKGDGSVTERFFSWLDKALS
jgi:Fe-S-cluster-containing dehydrogenase component